MATMAPDPYAAAFIATIRAELEAATTDREMWKAEFAAAKSNESTLRRERDTLKAENERLKEGRWKAEGEAHTTPCTYGPLCPWCEIERLKAQLAETHDASCENGHVKHEDCTEACSCVGSGKSKLERYMFATEFAEAEVARLTARYQAELAAEREAHAADRRDYEVFSRQHRAYADGIAAELKAVRRYRTSGEPECCDRDEIRGLVDCAASVTSCVAQERQRADRAEAIVRGLREWLQRAVDAGSPDNLGGREWHAVQRVIAKLDELEAHAKTKAALAEFVRWHGPAHEEGCSEDDTCNCAAKPANDAVNDVLCGYPLASTKAARRETCYRAETIVRGLREWLADGAFIGVPEAVAVLQHLDELEAQR